MKESKLKTKYIILDETLLIIVRDEKGNTIICDTEQEAYDYANEYINAYHIIEVPFGID